MSLVICPHCSSRVLPMTGRICPACRGNIDSPPDPASTARQTLEALSGFAAEQMRKGIISSKITKSLTEQGLDAEVAATVVRNLKEAEAKAKAHKRAARTSMLYGALNCLAGIAITAMTYQAAADSGGGTYVVAWGAILIGGYQFIRGWSASEAG